MITRQVMIELLIVSITGWRDELEAVAERLPPGGQDHRDVVHAVASMSQTLNALSHLPPLVRD